MLRPDKRGCNAMRCRMSEYALGRVNPLVAPWAVPRDRAALLHDALHLHWVRGLVVGHGPAEARKQSKKKSHNHIQCPSTFFEKIIRIQFYQNHHIDARDEIRMTRPGRQSAARKVHPGAAHAWSCVAPLSELAPGRQPDGEATAADHGAGVPQVRREDGLWGGRGIGLLAHGNGILNRKVIRM